MTDDSEQSESDGRDGSAREKPGSLREKSGSRRSDPPAFREARDHVREEVLRFVRALRRAGVAVPANAGTTALRALVEMGFDEESRARAALRACLVSDATEIATFDRQFGEFWRRLQAGLDPDGPAPRDRDWPAGAPAPLGGEPSPGESSGMPAGPDEGRPSEPEESDRVTWSSLGVTVSSSGTDSDAERVERAWYSPTGSSTAVDGPPGSAGELSAAFDELTAGLASVRGRRWRAGEGRPDARRALRSSLGTGGTVVSVPGREREPSMVRALWFVDVSRSVLDTLDRSFLLGTLRRANVEWRESRVVFFDEAPREVSGCFDAPTTDAALDALASAEAEWGGGTRIGESIGEFMESEPDAIDRRTVVFVVSDGLEMGDVSVLERQMATIARRSGGVVWLNPLAAADSYEPTARGMARALPFVDGLFAFTEPADLADVGAQLRRRGFGGPIGYEYGSDRETGAAGSSESNRETGAAGSSESA